MCNVTMLFAQIPVLDTRATGSKRYTDRMKPFTPVKAPAQAPAMAPANARIGTSAWYDSQYNNRVLVPEFPHYLERWGRASADAIAKAQAHGSLDRDVAYGTAPSSKLDIFKPVGQAKKSGAGAPVLVFLHGGYWRSLDKADFSFVAPHFTRAGAVVAIPNYALCPGVPEGSVTVPDIALQTAHCLLWLYRNIAQWGGDPDRITLVGHSAGGHLAAMLAVCRWQDFAKDMGYSVRGHLLKNVFSMSGLHELESIRQTPYLQSSLHLSEHDALRCSPAWMPAPQPLWQPPNKGRGELYTVCGGDESAEFQRQMKLLRKRWGQAAVPVCEAVPGRNHFSVLDAMLEAHHRLNMLVLGMLGLKF